MEFKSLNWLVGRDVELCGGIDLESFPDGGVKVIADFPQSILRELTFIKSQSRKVLFAPSKAKIFCGALKIRLKDSGIMIEPEDVKEQSIEGSRK